MVSCIKTQIYTDKSTFLSDRNICIRWHVFKLNICCSIWYFSVHTSLINQSVFGCLNEGRAQSALVRSIILTVAKLLRGHATYLCASDEEMYSVNPQTPAQPSHLSVWTWTVPSLTINVMHCLLRQDQFKDTAALTERLGVLDIDKINLRALTFFLSAGACECVCGVVVRLYVYMCYWAWWVDRNLGFIDIAVQGWPSPDWQAEQSNIHWSGFQWLNLQTCLYEFTAEWIQLRSSSNIRVNYLFVQYQKEILTLTEENKMIHNQIVLLL